MGFMLLLLPVPVERGIVAETVLLTARALDVRVRVVVHFDDVGLAWADETYEEVDTEATEEEVETAAAEEVETMAVLAAMEEVATAAEVVAATLEEAAAEDEPELEPEPPTVKSTQDS